MAAGGQPSPEGKAWDVVISDDREDGLREFSKKLKNYLQLSGMSASLDDDTTSIKSCRVFIPVLTKKYVHSSYCVGQLYVACRGEKDLLPVVYEDGWNEGEEGEGANVSSVVAGLRSVYFRPNKDDYHKSLATLVHSTKSNLGKFLYRCQVLLVSQQYSIPCSTYYTMPKDCP